MHGDFHLDAYGKLLDSYSLIKILTISLIITLTKLMCYTS